MGRAAVAVSSIFALLFLGILAIFIVNFPEEEAIETDSDMQGLVAQIEEKQILVVQGVTAAEIGELDEQELIDTADGAVYFVFMEEDALEELHIGMEVKVWYDTLDASFPGSGIGNRIMVLE